MAHIGKYYPTLPRSRLLMPEWPWPNIAATEYSWSVPYWLGSLSATVPVAGRNCVPGVYTIGTWSWDYSVTVPMGGGHVLTMTSTFARSPSTQAISVSMTGVVDLEVAFAAAMYDAGGPGGLALAWYQAGWTHGPAWSLLSPGGTLELQAYLWSDPAPAPAVIWPW
jgi:hypothetical protein